MSDPVADESQEPVPPVDQTAPSLAAGVPGGAQTVPPTLTTERGNVVVPPGALSPPDADSLSPQGKAAINTELKSDRDRRIMRAVAFGFFGLLSFTFFVILFWALVLAIFLPRNLAAALGALNTHSTVFASLLLLITATVPISLAFALIKISAEKDDGASKLDPSDVLPPHLRSFKECIDLLKSMRG